MYEVNHKKPFNGFKKEKTTFPVLIWDHSRPVTSYQLWNVVTHARAHALYSRQQWVSAFQFGRRKEKSASLSCLENKESTNICNGDSKQAFLSNELLVEPIWRSRLIFAHWLKAVDDGETGAGNCKNGLWGPAMKADVGLSSLGPLLDFLGVENNDPIMIGSF